ncbi:MAG TPA: glycoside hydrolase family 3 N-terminal domain-containing protein, partial [Gaiellaceae bacterium]|nr:glycoside hydrolase family 3 N-terminal domain-containing protein [Gaiellaceae bacterium]
MGAGAGRPRRRALTLAACAALLAGAGGASHAQPPAPTLEQLVGQKLVVAMSGTTPSPSLLARARRGQIGGVIVHGFNFRTAAQLRAITRQLHAAAAAGGQPRLLVAVDQEGGSVKTVPWIPPTVAPPRTASAGVAVDQGRRTGAALRALGIDADLAPVADVPASRASFVFRQGRTWSFDAGETTGLAAAFALGLSQAHALATMKHFPGLGLARANTDRYVVRIAAPKARLAPGLTPYRQAVAQRVPIVMLSNAVYDAWDR